MSELRHVLVYGDSLTWGIVPNTRQRLPFEQRWPGVMEAALVAAGGRVRVVEDALNGRRTAWDDPFKPGRNGLVGLEQRIEINSPLALVVVMLGTNDFQSMHGHDAWHSSQARRSRAGPDPDGRGRIGRGMMPADADALPFADGALGAHLLAARGARDPVRAEARRVRAAGAAVRAGDADWQAADARGR